MGADADDVRLVDAVSSVGHVDRPKILGVQRRASPGDHALRLADPFDRAFPELHAVAL